MIYNTKVWKHGGTLVVSVPLELAAHQKLKPGDEVTVRITGAAHPFIFTDAEIDELARAIMRKIDLKAARKYYKVWEPRRQRDAAPSQGKP